MTRDEAPKWFAERMAVKLVENQHKGGWENCDPWWLLDRLKEEIAELEEALDGLGDTSTTNEVVREAADVGNFAMMIADVISAKG